MQVDPIIPWSEWWPSFCSESQLEPKLSIERRSGAESNWAEIIDSLRSLNLFGGKKVVVISEAEKSLFKSKKEDKKLISQLQSCPHPVVFQSAKAAPKTWEAQTWKYQSPTTNVATDDKALFRWIDSISAQNIEQAVAELQASFQAGQHPLALLQLLGRHFRIGRLVQYAVKLGLSEQELGQRLNVPSFVIRRWKNMKAFSNAYWFQVFDKILATDLQLKSGEDELRCLRRLSFDLIQLNKRAVPKKSSQRLQKTSSIERSLLKVAPSSAS